jgi:hypothetical protein
MGTAIVRPTVHDHPRCPSMPTKRTRLGCARDPSHPAGLPAHLALQCRLVRLGVNADGEVLEAAGVSDCNLGCGPTRTRI